MGGISWIFHGRNTRGDLLKTRELAAHGVLYAPASFLATPFDDVYDTVNGCGAANSKFDFVPETIWGLYIGDACKIHDWMYEEGRTVEDKEEADRVFLNNILRLIDRDDKWYRPKFFLRLRARTYYVTVTLLGGPAFWLGKN